MRHLFGCLLVVVCAVVLLGVGSLLPRLAFSEEGVGSYAGEKRTFAKFALVYDLYLKEWPFPVDPTVARRVTDVSGGHAPKSPCTSEEGPVESPYYTGYFAGDYKAEVVHYGPFYGPFFVPTGKNVFNCDVAKTFSFFLPADTRGVLPVAVSVVVFFGALGVGLSVAFVPAFLMFGGGLLLAKGSERNHRAAGLIAGLLGFALAAVVILSIATTVI